MSVQGRIQGPTGQLTWAEGMIGSLLYLSHLSNLAPAELTLPSGQWDTEDAMSAEIQPNMLKLSVVTREEQAGAQHQRLDVGAPCSPRAFGASMCPPGKWDKGIAPVQIVMRESESPTQHQAQAGTELPVCSE